MGYKGSKPKEDSGKADSLEGPFPEAQMWALCPGRAFLLSSRSRARKELREQKSVIGTPLPSARLNSPEGKKARMLSPGDLQPQADTSYLFVQ